MSYQEFNEMRCTCRVSIIFMRRTLGFSNVPMPLKTMKLKPMRVIIILIFVSWMLDLNVIACWKDSFKVGRTGLIQLADEAWAKKKLFFLWKVCHMQCITNVIISLPPNRLRRSKTTFCGLWRVSKLTMSQWILRIQIGPKIGISW